MEPEEIAEIEAQLEPMGWEPPESLTAMQVLRLAAGESGAEVAPMADREQDTLPRWLFQRFGAGFKRSDEYDEVYWQHEAAAVRRAVARGGFKS